MAREWLPDHEVFVSEESSKLIYSTDFKDGFDGFGQGTYSADAVALDLVSTAGYAFTGGQSLRIGAQKASGNAWTVAKLDLGAPQEPLTRVRIASRFLYPYDTAAIQDMTLTFVVDNAAVSGNYYRGRVSWYVNAGSGSSIRLDVGGAWVGQTPDNVATYLQQSGNYPWHNLVVDVDLVNERYESVWFDDLLVCGESLNNQPSLYKITGRTNMPYVSGSYDVSFVTPTSYKYAYVDRFQMQRLD